MPLWLVITGLVAHTAAYIAGWLVLGVAMRLMTYDAAFASLAQIAGIRARRAISYLTLFGGLASTVFWPASHYLPEWAGWQNTLLVYAALHIGICLPVHALVLRQARGDVNGDAVEVDDTVPLVLFGAKGYGEVLGILAAPNLVLNAAAPLLFALLLDVSTPQTALMIAGGAALVSGLAMVWLARAYPH